MNRLSLTGRALLAGVVLTVVLLATACPTHHSIADLTRDPGRFMNKEVAVKGTVVESFGAMGMGMYKVDDGTGTLWVLSERYGVPAKGARVGVAGTITPTFTLGGRSFATVLRETDRRH